MCIRLFNIIFDCFKLKVWATNKMDLVKQFLYYPLDTSYVHKISRENIY